MTTIAVTAATGQFGRLVLAALDARQAKTVAIVRDPNKAEALLDPGLDRRVAGYDDSEALEAALAGVDHLIFISGTEMGQRVRQHGNVVEAARRAGVGHLSYTSSPHADVSVLPVAADHRATEELILASGLTYTILRNNWYHENYTGQVESSAAAGALIGSAGAGLVASAARQDYAEAAAAVATGTGHENRIYELAGDHAWPMAELAQVITELTQKPVAYRNLSPAEHVETLRSFGLDAGTAQFVAAIDAGVAAGDLADNSTGDLRRLLGRPTTPLLDGLRGALGSR